MAQSVEQLIRNQQAAGSSPASSSRNPKDSEFLGFYFLSALKQKGEVQMKKRMPLWDNLRFFLITLVVIGHFSDFFTTQCQGYQSLFLFMYPFHMPLFLLISGHFFRPEKITSKCLFYISIGFLLKLTIYGFTMFTGSATSFSLLSDGGIPWYLFVLAIYTVITYLLRNQQPVYVLVFSIILACAAGFDKEIGDKLYLSRAIVFFPFYWTGFLLKGETLLNLKKVLWVKILAAALLIGWIAACIVIPDKLYILRHLLTGRNHYAPEIWAWGPAYRLLTYLISALVCYSVTILLPNRSIPLISKMGANTLDVYFWHWPVFILLSRYLHIRELFQMGLWGKIAYLLIAVLLTVCLSQGGLISWPLNQIKKLCFYKKDGVLQ